MILLRVSLFFIVLLLLPDWYPRHVMEKDGFMELVGKENFCANITEALNRAEEIVRTAK